MSLSRNSLASLLASSEPLIIHHWDADGLAAAVTAASFSHGRADFVVPPFTYTPSREFIAKVADMASGKDLVVLVDYNISPESLASLVSGTRKPVVVIDHHVSAYPRVPNLYYYNPASQGDPEGLWPSAAHVLADAIGFYDPLLIAMSIYGDLQEEAPRNRVFRYYMEQIGLDPDQDVEIPRSCAMQVWGAEAAGDAELLGSLAYELAYGGVDPCQAIMSDPRLTNHRLRAEEEVERAFREAVGKGSRRGKAGVYNVILKMRVAGAVARRLAAATDLPVVILVARESEAGPSKIYVRGDISDPLRVIRELRGVGLRAAGKSQRGNNVVVVDIGHGDVKAALEKVVDVINAI